MLSHTLHQSSMKYVLRSQNDFILFQILSVSTFYFYLLLHFLILTPISITYKAFVRIVVAYGNIAPN